MKTMSKRFSLAFLLAAISMPGSVVAQTAEVSEPRLDVSRYLVDGETHLSEAEMEALLVPYVGERRSLQDIERAARQLEKYLHERGYVFHRVLIPAQKPSEGEIRLRVIRFNLNEVNVVGNTYFSSENIRRSLPAMLEGETPDMLRLARDLTAANANPAKHVAITFREGQRQETVDAEIRVNDVTPLAFFAGYTANKTVEPSDEAGLYRLTVGVQHSNLFDRDHVATLSYTTDPNHFSKVTLLGAYYQVPVYGHGYQLSGYYTYSDVNTGRVQQGGGFFDLSGKGKFYGLRLTRVLPRAGVTQQSVALAIDERYFENSSTFGGIKLQPDVATRPLSLRYTVQHDGNWGVLGGHVEYLANLDGGAGNRRSNYQLNGGDKNWDAWRFAADATLGKGQWRFTGRLRGQWSNDTLIAGEQFGVGGSSSVRGFGERELTGDYGYSWTLEMRTPELMMANLHPVFFIDGGTVHGRNGRYTESVLSAGSGLRWANQNFDLSLDLARVLDQNRQTPEKPKTRLHFSLFYRF